MPRVKLYIFDADGTLRWTDRPGAKYPLHAGEWRLMPGVAEKLRAIPFSAQGPWLGIASNQNGVAAGELSEETARQLMTDMLRQALGTLPPCLRIEMCICDETRACTCRKPAPGLLLRLLAHFGVGAEDTLFVGDLASDAEAARRVGMPFAYAAEFFATSDRSSPFSSE